MASASPRSSPVVSFTRLRRGRFAVISSLDEIVLQGDILSATQHDGDGVLVPRVVWPGHLDVIVAYPGTAGVTQQNRSPAIIANLVASDQQITLQEITLQAVCLALKNGCPDCGMFAVKQPTIENVVIPHDIVSGAESLERCVPEFDGPAAQSLESVILDQPALWLLPV